jgi:Arc/MetJ-type ribon-helix-helix transcriptional regulator
MDREITITVTEDEARRIDERVAAGEYASAADLAHAAIADFVAAEVADRLPDGLVRQLIEEDEADDGPDMGADEFADRLHHYIDELVARRDAKA